MGEARGGRGRVVAEPGLEGAGETAGGGARLAEGVGPRQTAEVAGVVGAGDEGELHVQVLQVPPTQAWTAVQVLPALPVGLPHAPVAPQYAGLLAGSMQELPHLIESRRRTPDRCRRCRPPRPADGAIVRAGAVAGGTTEGAVGRGIDAVAAADDLRGSAGQPADSALQTCPAGQTSPSLAPAQLPMAPQKVRSVAGSTQLPPQMICGEAQVSPQTPPLQTCPGGAYDAVVGAAAVAGGAAEAPVGLGIHAVAAARDLWALARDLAGAAAAHPPRRAYRAGAAGQAGARSAAIATVSQRVDAAAATAHLAGRQETWQEPAAHTWPAAEAVPSLAPVQSPEAPQKLRSVCG